MRTLTIVLSLVVGNLGWAGDVVEKEWQILADKAAKTPGFARPDLLRFVQRHGGTPQAVKAASRLRDIRSPLDMLDPKNIAAVEKFDWFPKETVALLGEHRGRQAGVVNAIAFSKNGKWIASASNNTMIRIWDQSTMRLLHTLGHPAGAYCVVFNKESTQLFHAGGDGEVVIEDMTVDPPKAKDPCKVASTPLLALALGPQAKWFIAGGSDTRLCVWDLSLNPPKEMTAGNGHTGGIHSIAISPDGKTIASGSEDKTIRLWSLVNNRLQDKGAFPAHDATVLGLQWYDEKTLVSSGAEGNIRVWSLVNGKLGLRFNYKGAETAVNHIAFSGSGKTLAAGFADGSARTFAFAPNVGLSEKTLLDGHNLPVNVVAFSPDSSLLATGSDDWTLRLWPIGLGPRPKDKTIKTGHWSHVYGTAFAPDEKGLVTSSHDRTVRYWDLTAAAPKERLPSMKADNALHTVAFAPDGKTVAAGGIAAKIHLFEPLSGRSLATLSGHESYINRLAFIPSGTVLASAAIDKTLRLWNPKTGKASDTITTFENYVNCLAYSPDGKYLVCCSGDYLRDDKGEIVFKNDMPLFADSTVRLFDTFGMREVHRWKSITVLPHSVAFSGDGAHFFAGCSDGLLRKWNTAAPKEPEIFFKNSYPHTALASSPDNRWLAVYGPEVYLLDLATGKTARTWSPGESFGAMAFAPDSRHVAVSLTTGITLVLRLEGPK